MKRNSCGCSKAWQASYAKRRRHISAGGGHAHFGQVHRLEISRRPHRHGDRARAPFEFSRITQSNGRLQILLLLLVLLPFSHVFLILLLADILLQIRNGRLQGGFELSLDLSRRSCAVFCEKRSTLLMHFSPTPNPHFVPC